MATNTKELSPTARNGQVKSNTQMNRSLIEISADLQKPVPPRMLKKKKVETKKGGYYELSYLPWYRAVRIMDFYCPGWEYEITDKTITTKDVMLTVRVWINAKEGRFFREATGIESLSTGAYGDPTSNAESMALRRACAKWGLGLDLYEKED